MSSPNRALLRQNKLKYNTVAYTKTLQRSKETLETIFSEKNVELKTTNPEKVKLKGSKDDTLTHTKKVTGFNLYKFKRSTKHKDSNSSAFFNDFNKLKNGPSLYKTMLNATRAKSNFLRTLADNHNEIMS